VDVGSHASPPFHLALPVSDLAGARAFYGALLGCKEGRAAPRWVDFDFFGHQLSVHLADDDLAGVPTNAVDGDRVPARHFGVILEWDQWTALHTRLAAAGVTFRIPPRTRFAGQPGEQGTFFVDDPAGNALEFKTFRDFGDVFRRD